jgi:hypothetical protein
MMTSICHFDGKHRHTSPLHPSCPNPARLVTSVSKQNLPRAGRQLIESTTTELQNNQTKQLFYNNHNIISWHDTVLSKKREVFLRQT